MGKYLVEVCGAIGILLQMTARFFTAVWIVSLLFMFTGCSPKQPKPYPSNIQSFKETFFADQKLAELVANISETESPMGNNPWPFLAAAAKHIKAGQNSEAKVELRKVLAMPGLEARVYLWTWTALRSLGEQPDSAAIDQPQGVIIEVPIDGGIDTLAAFADGSARYINHGGGAIIWDQPDKQINELAKDFVRSVEPLINAAKLSTERKPLSTSKERLTILTFAGSRVIEAKAGKMNSRVKAAATQLMLALIEKWSESKAQGKQHPANP